ncbi:uncharacterized protein LOC116924497 [Daphnia magna]|uniref:Uncharacterized protein n=2 Tax=Daphnia magna TaxID=35525 RepID=A0ABQ9ZR66_9CRUS|nr:uncharacterized protein LOC116924497 [Daphnia magna]KAK4015427.1 hypothetical protein OUZ56_030407 [Daphnia magna]KZS16275.1 Uncharacterized protein APZ42_017897 [Daphnia magna]
MNSVATAFILCQLVLTLWPAGAVAAPPAETNTSSKNLEDFRNHIRSTLTNYLMTQTHARYGKRMVPHGTSVSNNRNWNAQNPSEEWVGHNDGREPSGKDENLMDICFKINTSPEIRNLLLS